MTETAKAKTKTVQRGRGRPRGTSDDPKGVVGREALIDAALEILRTQPPSAITPMSVSRAMGVHTSLIRYYFKNRATLLAACAERLAQRSAETLEEAARRSDGSAESRLRARIGALIDLNAAYPYFHQLIVSEIAGMNDAAARDLITTFTHRGIGYYKQIVEAGLAEEGFRSIEPRLLYMAVIGMAEFFNSAVQQFDIADPGLIERERLLDVYKGFVCDLVLNGVRKRS